MHTSLAGTCPKLDPSYFTEHFGFVSDFLAEVWSQLRRTSRLDVLQGRLEWGSSAQRARPRAVNNTVDGLLRLLFPDPDMEVPAESLSWAASLALEARRRVKEAQAFIGAAEFGNVNLSFSLDGGPDTVVYLRGVGAAPTRYRRCVRAQRDPRERGPAGAGPCRGQVVRGRQGRRATPSARSSTGGSRSSTCSGRAASRRSTASTTRWRTPNARFKLFDSAAGYEAVRREIGALRKVHHPNVIEVFWAGKTSGGDWYLITEYIDGESLDTYATGKRHLRDREAVDVVRDVLDALIAIHPDSARLLELDRKNSDGGMSEGEYDEWRDLQEKGLVHRDIKPLNVMLTRAGAKLLDFNIASRVGDPVRTQSGTPPYQAPDADLTRWDVSTDLFAVGVMLYQLLCNGQHPYPNSRPIAGDPVIDPSTVRSDLDPQLAQFLVKACASLRKERFGTAREMKDALDAVRQS